MSSPLKSDSHPSKGDKIEVVKILILATVSFLGGFALVFLFLRPSAPTVDEDFQDPTDNAPIREPSSYTPDEPDTAQPAEPAEPVGQEDTGPGDEDSDQAVPDEGDAPAETPPGKTPDGVVQDGDAFYLKCWDDGGIEHKGSECDKLAVLEKRFSTRLYVVDKCRIDKAGDSTHGKLSIASEVDFQKMSISFWNGASSDIKNASEIGSCLKTSLVGLPIHEVDHKFARYRMFYTVLFGNQAEKKKEPETAKAAKFVAGKGKLVNVIKDRVRVRKTPVDGDVIGKISSGTQVRYLKKKDDWCNVITPNENEGWMICDALEL